MLEITGLDELSRKLKDLGDRAQELDGQHEIPLSELLTPVFVAGCSRFQSTDELFKASGFKVESTEDFKAIPDAEWDAFIGSNTAYSTWQAMLDEAVKEWTVNRLGL
jgi:hypothetical protein